MARRARAAGRRRTARDRERRHEHTADLVELALADLRRRRQDRTLRDWLRALPDDVVRRRPLLAAFAGWVRLSEGDLDGCEAWLDAAEAGLDGDAAVDHAHAAGSLSDAGPRAAARRGSASLPAMIAVYRASVAQARGDVEGTVVARPPGARARRAGGPLRPRCARPGSSVWRRGPPATSAPRSTRSPRRSPACTRPAWSRTSSARPSSLANMWLARGRPVEARRLYERALAAAESHAGPVLSTTGDLHVGLADVLREQGDLDAAARAPRGRP